MRKIRKALAMGDLILCLALAGAYGIFYGQNEDLKWRQTAAVNEVEEKEEEQAVEIRKIALTFDDGPHPCYTEELLDGLKERGVHATFFVTGDCVMILADWQNPVNKRVFVDLVLRKNAGCGVIFA